MSDTSETEIENVVGDDTVTIHRAPRYFRFMIAGAVVGVIIALILTFSFPEPAGFDFSQVFGFLALFFIVFGFAVGAVVALIIDRVSRHAARTINMERVEGGEAELRAEALDARNAAEAPGALEAPGAPEAPTDSASAAARPTPSTVERPPSL